jgi:hypothetical protein
MQHHLIGMIFLKVVFMAQGKRNRLSAEQRADDTKNRVGKEEWLEMIDATQRWIGRDSSSDAEQIVARSAEYAGHFKHSNAHRQYVRYRLYFASSLLPPTSV